MAPSGETCNRDHCALRGRCAGHVDHAAGINTCPSCIGRTRKDIAAIVVRYAVMAYDAQVDGVDSEAMNLLGAAADPDQYAARRDMLTALYERQGWCEWPRPEAYRADDPHHPYAVLGRWDMALRDQGWLGQTDLLVTVASAATALDSALNGGFPHGDEFEDFARDIAACRTHLEAVDHDDRVPEQGRPCPTCAAENEDGKAPRLQKRYAHHPGMPPGARCETMGCRTCDGRDDAWHCPAHLGHSWTDDEYRNRVDADYLEHAEALTADQLRQRFGISRGSITGWAAKGEVRKRGRDHHGRQLYDVAGVRAKLSTQQPA
jgi:hypothetical protein